MKKLVSLMLAVIMAIGISVPAFAEGAETVDVDNTFDNFTPGPGKQAPDNWYDPYCYDDEGHITPAALGIDGGLNAYYCVECEKIFTAIRPAVTQEGQRYFPYKTITTFLGPDGSSFTGPAYYCPYCGEIGNYNDWLNFHEDVYGVKFGSYCSFCGGFNVEETGYDYNGNIQGKWCKHCGQTYYPTENYRFLTEAQRTADYAFIFTETADQYVGGVDGKVEDVVVDEHGVAVYNPWHPEEAPQPSEEEEKKPTFWDKVVAFFNNIAKFFNSIFNAIAGIFK